MTTSGVNEFSLTATELIGDALRAAKVHPSGEIGSSEEFDDAKRALNMILKECQADGMFLHCKEDITLYLQDGTASYQVGPSASGAYSSTSVVETEVATAASSGDSTVVVDSITGISASDYLGIELDDGTMQWTTVSGAPAVATITLADVLTDDVAVDNIVVTFTSLPSRPVEITQVLRRDHDGNDIELTPLSRTEYNQISQKTQSGSPLQYYYDPQVTNGVIYLWPVPDDVRYRVIITSRRPIEYIDNITDDFELPQEWYRFLKWELAAEIASDYEIDIQTIAWLQSKADRHRASIEHYDLDKGSFFIQPVTR